MTRKSFSVFRAAIIFLLVFMVTTAPLQAAGDEQKIEQQAFNRVSVVLLHGCYNQHTVEGT
jgi:hypothetical protein